LSFKHLRRRPSSLDACPWPAGAQIVAQS